MELQEAGEKFIYHYRIVEQITNSEYYKMHTSTLQPTLKKVIKVDLTTNYVFTLLYF